MFETDDFDQALSQLDFPEDCNKNATIKYTYDAPKKQICGVELCSNKVLTIDSDSIPFKEKETQNSTAIKNLGEDTNIISPKYCKRKIIKSHFDSHSKRKFPGPAGLLTGSLEEYKNKDVEHIELLSQDIDFTQNPIHKGLFESVLWKQLQEDLCTSNLKCIESIKTVKHLAHNRNTKYRKAQIITAFVESVDRSAMDPLIILRDLTGNIKCTLHRDAWSNFSLYIVPECCALILYKPTVLTTGSAFKKHYLNITLSNILAIYSSIVSHDEQNPLPDGFEKYTNENYTLFKMERKLSETTDNKDQFCKQSNDFFEDLDNVFCDEIF